MIVALIYGRYDYGLSVAEWLVITSSEEEMKTRLETITSKRLHPQPIPDKFEVGQKIALGKSKHAFAKIMHMGPLPKGGLVI